MKCTTRRLLRAVIGGLTVMLGLCQLWLLWHPRSNHQAPGEVVVTVDTNSQPISEDLTNIKYKHADSLEKLEIRVLLQQSPVLQKEQHIRLGTIDGGWAAWDSEEVESDYNIRVYASIFPEDAALYKGRYTLRHIQPIRVHADLDTSAEPNTDTGTDTEAGGVTSKRKGKPIADSTMAMQRMIESFLWVLTSDTNADDDADGEMHWLVYSNDHAFFIPPNLAFALSSLDPGQVIYTGNLIGMQKTKDLEIEFASGGAGAVLSHAALKCVVLSWVLMQPERIEEALCHLTCHQGPGSKGQKRSVGCIEGVREAIRSQLPEAQDPRRGAAAVDWSGPVRVEDVAALLHWKAWTMVKKGNPLGQKQGQKQEQGQGTRNSAGGVSGSTAAVPTEIEVLVSSRTRVSVTFDEQHAVYLTIVKTNSEGHEERTDIDKGQLRRHCLDNSKWGLINPGISVASCMRFVFQATSPDTRWRTNIGDGRVLLPALSTSSTSDLTGAIPAGTVRERFNVYGPLRTALGDFDPWYAEKKPDETGVSLTLVPQSMPGSVPYTPVPVVSFHYVSEHESDLLFHLLRERAGQLLHGPVTEACPIKYNYNLEPFKKHPSSGHMLLTPRKTQSFSIDKNYTDLYRLWYTNTDAKLPIGAYSRRLKTLEEAQKLYQLLYCDIVVL